MQNIQNIQNTQNTQNTQNMQNSFFVFNPAYITGNKIRYPKNKIYLT